MARPLPHLALACLLALAAARAARAHDLALGDGRTRVLTPAASAALAPGAEVLQWRVRWENAWRAGRAHDGVWLFLKYRVDAGPWRHATLERAARVVSEQDGGEPLVGAQVAADRRGLHLARTFDGRGPIDVVLALGWDHAADGVALPAARVELALFGVEMVHVPQGAFWIGDPGGSDPPLVAALHTRDADGARGPLALAGETELAVGDGPGEVWYEAETPAYQGDQAGVVGAAFPKGVDAFWVMKYELTQGQYAAFLNTLGEDASSFRANFAGRGYGTRRGTLGLREGRYVAERPGRACNRLTWDDGCAWADWAALRPLTELEFEKAARGTRRPTAGEYPWGPEPPEATRRLLDARGDPARREDGRERADGNASFGFPWEGPGELRGGDGGRGPLRAGIYEAAHPDDARAAGASPWFVMELAGNVWERCVTLGDPVGRAFCGTHGDGELTWDGRATNPDWPSTPRGGYGYRGGSWYNEAEALAVADRRFAAWSSGGRGRGYGFRAARTADGERRVLFLGTGHLRGLPELFRRLTLAAGVARPASVVLHAVDGDSFERMGAEAGPGSYRALLEGGDFDWVVLQESGVLAGSARRDPRHARPLVAAARVGGATPVLAMTWAYANRPSVSFEMAMANAQAWGEELDLLVAPFGLAWRRVRDAGGGDALYGEDGAQPSEAGRWLNACVLYALVYGAPPAEAPATFTDEQGRTARVTELDPQRAARLATLAWEVVRAYRQPRRR